MFGTKKMKELELADNVRHTDTIFIKDGYLYKIFKDFQCFDDEKERNITYLINNRIPNTPIIKKKISKRGKFIGYIMQYIPNTITFREAINTDIEYEKREKAIMDIYEGLKVLHEKGLILGDIHSDNFLISEDGSGYLIDLEELRAEGDEFKFKSMYFVKPSNKRHKINKPSIYTDNIKMMISSLSLLYGIDLEQYVSRFDHSINIEELYNEVISKFNDEKLDEYFRRIINDEEVEYFTNFYFNKEKVL